MSDMTSNAGGLTINASFGKEPRAYSVDETYWGYIVQKGDGPATPTVILQGMSMFMGASFAAAALGLLLAPHLITGSTDIIMRSGASVLFGAIAAYLLWFASRGSQSEIQIDNTLGEVREVVRNRAGKPSLIGRYGFDSIGGVFLDRANAKGTRAVLMLRYRNTAQTLPVATGPESELVSLKDRLGRDLMLEQRSGARHEAVAPDNVY